MGIDHGNFLCMSMMARDGNCDVERVAGARGESVTVGAGISGFNDVVLVPRNEFDTLKYENFTTVIMLKR